MKRILLFCLAVSLTACAGACSGSSAQESSPSSAASSVSEPESSSASDRQEITITSSSASSPLSLNVWGSAAKYSTASGEYVETPIRLLSVRRGESVKEEVRRLAEKSSFAVYREPDKDKEYALVTYELSLDGFPVKEGGTLIDVFATVTGTDGEMLKLANGSYYSTTAMCLNDDDAYFYEGVATGMMAYQIPKNCTDYLLVIGEPGESLAYFKGL